MGDRYLIDLADVLAAAGLEVVELDGWQSRARGSGGYEPGRPTYVMVHHTASPPSSSGEGDAWYCAEGDEDAPLSNLCLDRDGRWWVLAAGATNTNGKGGPVDGVPADSMNTYAIGVEANGGYGEAWPAVQTSSYVAGVAALCARYDIPSSRVMAHFEWAPDRKIDPAGPSPWASGSSSWDMAAFRDDVHGGPAPPEPEPAPPKPKPPTEGDWMADLPTLKKGSSGPYVERMQHLLAAAGYMNPANTANYDGKWGDGTEGAKQKFDTDHGLTPSPPTDCGDKSWESLLTGRKW